MICQTVGCQNTALETGAPKTWLFSIPLTDIEVHIYHWGKTEPGAYCEQCLYEQEQPPEFTAEDMSVAYTDGYTEARRDMERREHQ